MPRGRTRKTKDDVLLKSADLIGWALGGLEREIAQTRERLTTLTAQATKLRERIGSETSGGAFRRRARSTAARDSSQPRVKRRRTMSPQARKRISEMMKKRWAERRKSTA